MSTPSVDERHRATLHAETSDPSNVGTNPSRAGRISLNPSSGEPGSDIINSEDAFVVVMGATGSGKTSFINAASGSTLRVGSELMSCTDVVQFSNPFLIEGRTVRLIDTPGFDDTTKTDTEVLTMIAITLSSMYQFGVKLSGAIYIHRISDFRMGGTSTRNFKMFRELCGDTALQNVVIVTNMWSEVSFNVGEAREKQLKSREIFFKPALDKGAQIRRHDNTSMSAQGIVRCVVSKDPLALRIQQELVDEHKDIAETTAGAEIGRELHEQAMRYQAERRRLQDELNEASRQKDEDAREELEQVTAQLNNEMMRVQIDSERLASSYSEETERLVQLLRSCEAASRQERERQAIEHSRRMANVNETLGHTEETNELRLIQAAFEVAQR